MDAARAWLESGGLLDKAGKPGRPDFDALRAGAASGSGAATSGLCGAALAHLRAIQDELAAQAPAVDHDELISIAVDDMKIVTALMKLVVVFGIYPHVTDDAAVPLEPRLTWPLPPKRDITASNVADLSLTTQALVTIVLKNDDLSSLILVSPFLVDLLAASSFFPPLFAELLSRCPTFTLYKLLIQLRARPAPQPAIVQSLGELPVNRKDAVRTLIELVIEPKTPSDREVDHAVDLHNAGHAAQVLAAVPPTVSKVAYIRAIGTQLFALLAGSAGHSMADAAARVVAALSELQPRLVGELRNLLVRPFETPDTRATTSLAAALRLAESTQAQYSGLFTHVAARICPAVWLLVNASKTSLKGELDSAYLALLARMFESSPEVCMRGIIHAFTTSTVPNTRLAWTGLDSQQPTLIETVGTDTAAQSQGLLQQIDARLDVLVTVLAKVADAAATAILIFVLQWYVNGSTANDPLTSMVLAKTVERLAKDSNLRPKLFSDPDQIVQLSFRLISANTTQQFVADVESRLKTANIADADSDDEDDFEDDDDKGRGPAGSFENPASEERQALVELSLSLLGSALMESLGSSEESQPKITEEQLSLLNRLSRNYPRSVRSKADFCLQLLDGSRREQKEVDMDNNAEVLAAARSALQEPLVPSRAYGLYLFTKLVERHAVSLKVAMSAFLDELRDDDSYVYLNAIKGIETAARVADSSEVLDLLLPVVDSKHAPLDAVLRAREALVRVLSPGTAMRLSTQLVETLLSDLRASARDTRDIRFRLSSCSLLGIVISQYPHALSETQENDAADCALGILRYEHAPEEQALRKSAVILALEIVNAVNEGAFAGGLAKTTLSSLITEIESLMHQTDDSVLLEHCRAVMESVSPVV